MFFDDKLVIGRVIKKYRKAMKVTQEELSEIVNISEKHLSKIENGVHYPSLVVFFNIVKYLKIPFNEFGIDTHNDNNEKKNFTIEKILKNIYTLNNDELEYLTEFIEFNFNNYKIKHK